MAGKTRRVHKDSIVEMNKTAYEDEIEVENPTVAKTLKSDYNQSVRLMSIFPAHIKINGSVTGKPYEWVNPGDIVSVEEDDAADLLSREIGGAGGCCGSASGRSKLLEKVI